MTTTANNPATLDAIMQVQLKMYQVALEKIMPRNPATIRLFVLIFPFFLEQDYYSAEELRRKVLEKSPYSISQRGFNKHINILKEHGLLSRKHRRAFGLNIQRIQSLNNQEAK